MKNSEMKRGAGALGAAHVSGAEAGNTVVARRVPVAVIAAWMGHASSFGRVVTSHDTESGSQR
jgi:hypothetical protein